MNTNHDDKMIELELKKFKENSLPDDLELKILEGFSRGQRLTKRREIAKHIGLSVVALFLVFVLSVNFIPGFGNVASNIPGLEKIIEIVDYDKGLKSAVENEYVQVIGKSDTNEGVTFNIDHVIIDKRRLIVLFSIETEKYYDSISVKGAKVLDEDGKVFDEYSASYPRLDIAEGNNTGILDFRWNEDQPFTDELTLEFQLHHFKEEEPTEGIDLPGTYNIIFPVDLEKIKHSETYTIDQTGTIHGQDIYFEKLVSFPTREVLYLEYDNHNTKKILHLSGLRLENENGETVAKEDASSLDGNKRIVSLDSNYFQEFEELYVVIDKVMAVDKDKAKIVVDLENEKLLEAPDERLKLESISKENMFDLEEALNFHFIFKEMVEDDVLRIEVGNIVDATGVKVSPISEYSSYNDYGLVIEDKEYANPITMEVYQYPTYIEGDIKIRIK